MLFVCFVVFIIIELLRRYYYVKSHVHVCFRFVYVSIIYDIYVILCIFNINR